MRTRLEKPSVVLHSWREALFHRTPVAVPCDSCVACCRAGLFVTLTEAEAKRLPHDRSEEGVPRLLHRDRDCIMFDAEHNRCSIYETRPRSCREYDCRMMWLGGLRSTTRGSEVNERLEQWRVAVHNDLDLGIVAMMWLWARESIEEGCDVGMAAACAASRLILTPLDELRKMGRKARRGGVVNVLNMLNGTASKPHKNID